MCPIASHSHPHKICLYAMIPLTFVVCFWLCWYFFTIFLSIRIHRVIVENTKFESFRKNCGHCDNRSINDWRFAIWPFLFYFWLSFAFHPFSCLFVCPVKFFFFDLYFRWIIFGAIFMYVRRWTHLLAPFR